MGATAIDSILWHFLAVRWVSLQLLIVVFPGHTHFLKSDQIFKQQYGLQQAHSLYFTCVSFKRKCLIENERNGNLLSKSPRIAKLGIYC